MAEKKYDPPEAEIQRFLDATGSDPRKMAVAYLRARKRAASNELALRTFMDLDDIQGSLAKGDAAGALKRLRRSTQRLKSHNKGVS